MNKKIITIKTNNKNIRWNPMKTLVFLATTSLAVIIAIKAIAFTLPLLHKGIQDALDYDHSYYSELHEDAAGMTVEEYLDSLNFRKGGE